MLQWPSLPYRNHHLCCGHSQVLSRLLDQAQLDSVQRWNLEEQICQMSFVAGKITQYVILPLPLAYHRRELQGFQGPRQHNVACASVYLTRIPRFPLNGRCKAGWPLSPHSAGLQPSLHATSAGTAQPHRPLAPCS